jgi:hypothetical protein
LLGIIKRAQAHAWRRHLSRQTGAAKHTLVGSDGGSDASDIANISTFDSTCRLAAQYTEQLATHVSSFSARLLRFRLAADAAIDGGPNADQHTRKDW